MIVLSPKQEEAMDAVASEQYRFILYGGAMGGGKTWWGLSALLIMCQVFPKSRWCVIREDLEKIRTTTIPSFRKLNPSGTLRSSPWEYTHPNGSVILFKGENYDNDKDLQWLKGLEVNGFLFEEINECQYATLDIAFGRAGRWKCDPMPSPIILGTCNPTFNWVKTMVYDKWKEGQLPDKWLYIPALITDNPYLTEDYLENLKNMTRLKYEQMVLGNWDIQMKTGGEFYKSFELDRHVGRYPYNPDLPLHISWDDNSNPYLPCGVFQIEGKALRMIDEIAGRNPNNSIKAVCAEFTKRYQGHQSGVFIYGDATAEKQDTKMERGHTFYRLIMDALQQFRPQLRVPPSNPSVVMRGNFINLILEKEYDGITFGIDENCRMTIADFVNTKEAADGTKNKEMETDPTTKVRYQRNGHFSDLTDYFLCRAFAESYAKYQNGGRTARVAIGRNLAKNAV